MLIIIAKDAFRLCPARKFDLMRTAPQIYRARMLSVIGVPYLILYAQRFYRVRLFIMYQTRRAAVKPCGHAHLPRTRLMRITKVRACSKPSPMTLCGFAARAKSSTNNAPRIDRVRMLAVLGELDLIFDAHCTNDNREKRLIRILKDKNIDDKQRLARSLQKQRPHAQW